MYIIFILCFFFYVKSKQHVLIHYAVIGELMCILEKILDNCKNAANLSILSVKEKKLFLSDRLKDSENNFKFIKLVYF